MRTISCFFILFVPLAAQTIDITPSKALVDETVTIRVSGCQPGEHLTLQAELTDGAGRRWVSQSEFAADAQGGVDVSKQAPIGGSYKDVSAMGPVWSMKPVGSKEGRYQPPSNFGAQSIEFHLMRGGAIVSTAHLEQTAISDGISRLTVHEGRLRGILFSPSDGAARPAILVVGGSEGGLPTRRAAWFASHGYAALALAYFRFDDLPRELLGIPLEYFGEALAWMSHRPEIMADRIAVSGTSRGGELALQLGSMYAAIRAVVAYVPANARYPACCDIRPQQPAWTWKGYGLAFDRVSNQGPISEAGAEIAVEQTHAPILLISGGEDHVWSSSSMTDSLVSRLRRAHFGYEVVRLNYPHAGHSAGRPEIVPEEQGSVRNPTSGREMEMGGTPKGNAESSLDAPAKVLAFLKRNLSDAGER